MPLHRSIFYEFKSHFLNNETLKLERKLGMKAFLRWKKWEITCNSEE